MLSPIERTGHGGRENSPRISSRLDRLVVPMMGAVTPGLAMIHASEICAMLTPFCFASSSTLYT